MYFAAACSYDLEDLNRSLMCYISISKQYNLPKIYDTIKTNGSDFLNETSERANISGSDPADVKLNFKSSTIR
jgi:hypothetical protein